MESNNIKFKTLNPSEVKNLEIVLKQKKMKFRVKNSVIRRKSGNKSGRTQYVIDDDRRIILEHKKVLTLLEFCKLYNNEMMLCGQQNLYSKVVRNQMILNYFYTKNWLETKLYKRTRQGVQEEYMRYWIKSSFKEHVLNFFIEYLSSDFIDNATDIRNMINKNPKAIKNPEKVNEYKDYRVNVSNLVKLEKDTGRKKKK